MPRRTRAGQRATIHEDDSSSRESTPVPETPTRASLAREPLGEISILANMPFQPEVNVVLEIDLSKIKRTPKKGDLRNLGRSDDKENVQSSPLPEVLEDMHASDGSLAAEEAARELLRDKSQAASMTPVREHPKTPSSRAAIAARKQLRTEDSGRRATTKTKGAAESIKHEPTCSPASKALQSTDISGLKEMEGVEINTAAVSVIEDASIEHEVLVPFGTEATVVQETHTVPLNLGRKKAQAAPSTTSKRALKTMGGKSNQRTKDSATRKLTLNSAIATLPKAAGPASMSKSGPEEARPISIPSKHLIQKNQSPARPAALRKPPFVPKKSAKPATAPIFALPGEAVAAKLKAQREERMQRRASTVAPPPLASTIRKGKAKPLANTATVRGTTFTGPNSRARPSACSPVTAPPNRIQNVIPRNPVGGSAHGAKVVASAINTSSGTKQQRAPRSLRVKAEATKIEENMQAKSTPLIGSTQEKLSAIFTPPNFEVACSGSTSFSVVGANTNSAQASPTRTEAVTRAVEAGVLKNAVGRTSTTKWKRATSSRPLNAATIGATSGASEAPKAPRKQISLGGRAKEVADSTTAWKAREEAARKGREASRAWAEKHWHRQKHSLLEEPEKGILEFVDCKKSAVPEPFEGSVEVGMEKVVF